MRLVQKGNLFLNECERRQASTQWHFASEGLLKFGSKLLDFFVVVGDFVLGVLLLK